MTESVPVAPALTGDGHRRSGRPRDPSCDEAIVKAALDLFEQDGYDGVTIEGVAARAGVGKATVYRRYSNKAELVIEAVRRGTAITEQLPDTGDLRADLASMARPLFERLRGSQGRLLVRLISERLRHRDLAEAFERVVVGRKREHMRALVQGAVDRGDLPADADVELIAEAAPALLWHHALNGLPFPADLPDRIVDLVLPPRPTARRRRSRTP